MKNENKHDDMISILEHMLKFVPAVTRSERVEDPESSDIVEINSQEETR